jgi:hypothetical protein
LLTNQLGSNYWQVIRCVLKQKSAAKAYHKMCAEAKAKLGMNGVERVRLDAHRDAMGGLDIDRRCFPFDTPSYASSRRTGGLIAMISLVNGGGVVVVRPIIWHPIVRAEAATKADWKMRAGFKATAMVITNAA